MTTHDSEAEPVASQETASLVKRLAGPSTGKAGLDEFASSSTK